MTRDKTEPLHRAPRNLNPGPHGITVNAPTPQVGTIRNPWKPKPGKVMDWASISDSAESTNEAPKS